MIVGQQREISLSERASFARITIKTVFVPARIFSASFAALESGDYPWLAASRRTRFQVALIDEFQDTDPLQFSLFDTIYGAGESPLFLVGDPNG